MSERKREPSENEPTTAPAARYGATTVIAGRYKLLEEIGEGGMGTVWMAEQAAPVKRRVALKLIKPGMDSRQVISRFEAERQALALMDHPHIARVYDGGMTEEGRPFFVMEYVKGIPITDYCNQAKLPVADRLKLFISVCHAIQHAHQKGIIHRDLKPSNILVCLYDGQPVPKVIDFGLAKAMVQPLTEHTLFTAHGMMVGTPTYMSPEQAEFNNLDIDTRSDIYSLGVILYELLTGTTPLERRQIKDAAWNEVLRLIKDVEAPKPSTRLSTSENVARIASERGTEPAQLSRVIKGDLDWIVMKAVEKERSRRYETPNGLAQDIERYLRQETVLACPPSTAYRVRKLIQRNRAAVMAVGAVALCLLLGTVVSTLLAIHATGQRNLAQQRFVEATGQRRAAEEATAAAQHERDRTKKANELAEEQRRQAEEQKRVAEEQRRLAIEERQKAEMLRQTAEKAQLAEAGERKKAEQERDRAQGLLEALDQQKEQQRRMLYVGQMNLVQRAWDGENITRVRELLNSTRPRPGEADLRGFEWHYWQSQLHSDQKTLKLKAAAGASAVALSHDGKQFAAVLGQSQVGGMRYRVVIWDTATGKELLTRALPFEEGTVGRTVNNTYIPPKFYRSFQPVFVDGERVGVLMADRPETYVSGATAADIQERQRTARQTMRLMAYRTGTGEEAFALETTARLYASASESFQFNRDGSRVISLPSSVAVKLWEGRTGESLGEFALPIAVQDSTIPAMTADGKLLAVFGLPPKAAVGASNGIKLPFLGPVDLPRLMDAGAVANRAITLLDLDTGKRTLIPLSQQYGTAASINAFTGTTTPISIPQPSRASQLQFSPDGNWLVGIVTAAGQSAARIWSTGDGQERCRISEPTGDGSFTRMVFSPDGKWLATRSNVGQQEGKSIRLWDTASGRLGAEFRGHAQAVTRFAFSSDGKSLISIDGEGVFKTWRIPPENRNAGMPTFRVKARSTDGMWTAIQSISAFLTFGSAISLEDATRARPPRHLSLPGAPTFALFSPDATYLLTACVNSQREAAKAGELTLWETATGSKHVTIEVPAFEGSGSSGATGMSFPGAADGTAFSPDGRRLAMILRPGKGGQAPMVRVWDVAQGRELLSAALPMNVPALQFSSDSQLLAFGQTGSIQGTNTNYIFHNAQGGYTTSGQFSGIEAWDSQTGAVRVRQPMAVSRLAFSPRGGLMVTVSHDLKTFRGPPRLTVWDTKTGAEISSFALELGRTYLQFVLSPDDRRLAAVSSLGPPTSGTMEIAIMDAQTGEKLFSLQGQNGAVTSVAFSPDGQRIATSAGLAARYPGAFEYFLGPQRMSGETKIWDAASGQELLTLAGGSEALLFSDKALGPDPAAYANRNVVRPRWEAEPIPAEVEAAEIVEALLAEDRGGRLTPRGQWMEQVRKDPSLSEESRQIALGLLRQTRRDALALNDAALAILRVLDATREEYLPALAYAREATESRPDKDKTPRDYERALDLATEASESDPANLQAYSTRGVAHYRLGHFAQAQADFEQSIKLHTAKKRNASPEDIVFLAMTHHRLGNTKAAQDDLARAQQIVKRSGSTKLPGWRAHLAEAEELFGVPKPPPRTLAESIPGWGRPVDPAGDCEFSASGDSLILKIPGTLHSLSPANNNFDAPRVLQEIEGDFTLQVKVAFPLEPKTPLTDRAFTFISAGLVVWENADHSLRVERDAYFTHPNYPTGAVIPPPSQTPPQLSSHAPLVEYMQGALEVSGIPKSWNAKDPPLPGPATWLRLTRRGQKFESYLSHDGREWQIVPVIETKFPSQVQVGVVARNNSGSEFRAEFSDVQLTRP